MRISVETAVKAPPSDVWSAWTSPEDIVQWNAASEDWHTPSAEIDLREGGQFTYRMEAKDGSMGFDFFGTFTRIVENTMLEYSLEDDRRVLVEFIESPDSVTVRETFDADSEHEGEQQRQGWQAILDNFARHVETKAQS